MIDTAIPCGLVLNELISNALKHAFPGDMTGEIRVQVNQAVTGDIEIRVSDNGIGVPDGFDFRESGTLGLQTVFAVVEHQLQGAVTFEVDDGTTCHIRFSGDSYEARV